MNYWHYPALTGQSLQSYRYSIVEVPDLPKIYWETDVGSLDAPGFIATGGVWRDIRGIVTHIVYRSDF